MTGLWFVKAKLNEDRRFTLEMIANELAMAVSRIFDRHLAHTKKSFR